MEVSLRSFNGYYWTEVSKKVKKAAVFMDSGMAEVLHWNGGFLRLKDALSIHEFSSFVNGAENEKKAVFLLSSPLDALALDILKDIIKNSKFEYVIVVTTAPPALHSSGTDPLLPTSNEIFQDLQLEILETMDNVNYTCEIFHFPLFFAPVCNDFFVIPTFSGLFPLLAPDLVKARVVSDLFRTTSVSEEAALANEDQLWNIFPSELQAAIRHFVFSFDSLLERFNLKEDIFTVGKFSSVIGNQLEALPSAKNRRRKSTTQNKASVIFIDRTLDLATPVSNRGSTVLDLIFETLPRFGGGGGMGFSSDVRVDMSELHNSLPNNKNLAPGCLADDLNSVLSKEDEDPRIEDTLGFFIKATQKNVVKKLANDLRKASKDLINDDKEDIELEIIERIKEMSDDEDEDEDENENDDEIDEESEDYWRKVTRRKNRAIIREIKKLTMKSDEKSSDQNKLELALRKFNLQPKAISKHLNLVQKAMAVKLSLVDENPRISRMNKFQNELLKELKGPRPENTIETLITLIKKRKENSLSLEDFLTLLVFVYTHIPDASDAVFDPMADDKLQSLLADEILEQSAATLEPVFDHLAQGLKVDELHAHRMVKNIFARLKSLNETQLGVDYIESFMENLYSEDRRDIEELVHKSESTLGGILKTGISLFGVSVNKRHPRENPIIFIIVIGGIAPKEIKIIREIVGRKKSSAQIIVGSTRILSSKDSLDVLFVNNSLFTD